jgi:hypothetical protein
VRYEDLLQLIQSHLNRLEASAREIRTAAIDIAPSTAAGYIKSRDESTQLMISNLKEATRNLGGGTELKNRKD